VPEGGEEAGGCQVNDVRRKLENALGRLFTAR